MENCIFCKIARGDIPKEFKYQDDLVMVFEDIKPYKPIHLLIVPKEHVVDFLSLKDSKLISRLIEVTQKMVVKTGLVNKGYRVSINGGDAQMIKHLHIHLFGPLGKDIEF